MLWVLKRTVSMRRIFWAPKNMFKLMDKKTLAILRKLFLLSWPYAHGWQFFGDFSWIQDFEANFL